VALTWFDTSGVSPSPYSSNTPVTVMDGATVEGSISLNQQAAPDSFPFDGVSWRIVGFFDLSEPTLTVTMTNTDTDGVILADGVLVARIGGGVPTGNSAATAPALPQEPLSTDTLRGEPVPAALYWSDEVEHAVTLLAEDVGREPARLSREVDEGADPGLQPEPLDPSLPDWLD
jgi:hypothetical protein